jgi:uncharacterized protein (DUF362 family)
MPRWTFWRGPRIMVAMLSWSKSVKNGMTRREALAVSAGCLSLTRCSLVASHPPQPRVSIVRAAYSQSIYDTVRRLLVEHRVDVRGKRVVLKPNLVEFDPGTTINTHPMLVHAAMEGFRAMGAADVRIAEGPGHRRITMDLADAAGYFDTIPRFEDLFTDLNLDEVSQVLLREPFSRLNSVYFPNTALGADLLVSLPKMKTHHWVGATLSMKNFFGLVPGGIYGWPKNVLHWAGIDECIADFYAAFPRHFAIVDGVVGMEGNGPIQGNPKPVGVLVAGTDMTAVDATCCRIMGINPSGIRYLRLAAGPSRLDAGNIRQIGVHVKDVETPFELIPEFQTLRT